VKGGFLVKFREGLFYYPYAATAYLIDGGSEAALLDCGFEKDIQSLFKEIEKEGLDLAKIKKIIVTHAHCDHVGGIKVAKESLRCQVLAHILAVKPIEEGDLVSTAAELPWAGHSQPFSPCKVDEVLREGDVVDVGRVRLKVYHTPGHTPGSIALGFSDCLAVGDTIFANGGVGWIDTHWGSNVEDYLDSIKRIEALSPEWILPAHGEPFRFDPDLFEEASRILGFYIDPKNGLGIPRALRAAQLLKGSEG